MSSNASPADYTITVRPCAVELGQYRWIVVRKGGSEALRSQVTFATDALALAAAHSHVKRLVDQMSRRL